jgi:hypothetical protein
LKLGGGGLEGWQRFSALGCTGVLGHLWFAIVLE